MTNKKPSLCCLQQSDGQRPESCQIRKRLRICAQIPKRLGIWLELFPSVIHNKTGFKAAIQCDGNSFQVFDIEAIFV